MVAYLVAKEGMSVDEALAYVRARRPEANPNEGFMRQLRVYEKNLTEAD